MLPTVDCLLTGPRGMGTRRIFFQGWAVRVWRTKVAEQGLGAAPRWGPGSWRRFLKIMHNTSSTEVLGNICIKKHFKISKGEGQVLAGALVSWYSVFFLLKISAQRCFFLNFSVIYLLIYLCWLPVVDLQAGFCMLIIVVVVNIKVRRCVIMQPNK